MVDSLRPLMGNLTAETVASLIPGATHSGDVHIAVYDFTPGREAALIAIGTTDANGTYTGPAGRNAWAAPFVRFATKALWSEPRPPASW